MHALAKGLPSTAYLLVSLLVSIAVLGAPEAQGLPRAMPPRDKEFQAALADLFSGSIATIYANTPALIAVGEKNKLTDEQIIQQGILYAANGPEPDVRHSQTMILMPHLQMVFRIPITDVMSAAVPFLEESVDTPEFAVARDTLEIMGALETSSQFGHLSDFGEIGRYLRQHPDQPPPFALVALMYTQHPSAALSTLIRLNRVDADTAEGIYDQMIEVERMVVDIVTHRDTEQQRARLIEIVSLSAKSPHWFVRLYAAALARRPELRRLDLPDIPQEEKNEIVSRFLREVLLKKE